VYLRVVRRVVDFAGDRGFVVHGQVPGEEVDGCEVCGGEGRLDGGVDEGSDLVADAWLAAGADYYCDLGAGGPGKRTRGGEHFLFVGLLGWVSRVKVEMQNHFSVSEDCVFRISFDVNQSFGALLVRVSGLGSSSRLFGGDIFIYRMGRILDVEFVS